MKQYILFITLFIFAFTTWAQAQRPEPTGGCVQDDECFTFRFIGAEASDNNVTLTFSIRTNCDRALSYAAFELPEGARVIAPNSNYKGTYRYGIENPTNNPFYSVKFEAKKAEEYKNGASDTFSFTIPASDYENLSTLRVQAKAARSVGAVTFDLNACSPKPAACLIEGNGANFAFTGANDNGDGTTTVNLMIQNLAEEDVNSITVQTELTTEAISVAGLTEGNVYSSENFQYKVKVNQEENLIIFDAQNTNGYASGASDIFSIIVPTELYELEPYFLMTVTAGETFESAGLNTISCEDEPITPLPVELMSF